MKKYLLGIIAIITAVAFSAFTPAQKLVLRDTTPMLWYEVAPDGKLADYQNPENSSPLTKSAFITANPSACVGTGTDCVRGFDNTVHVPTSATDRTEDDIIEKN